MRIPETVRTGLFCLLGDIGDAVFWMLIVIAAVAALTPLAGITIATETVRARRAQRLRTIRIDAAHGGVWACQLLRNSAATEPVFLTLARTWLNAAEQHLPTRRLGTPGR